MVKRLMTAYDAEERPKTRRVKVRNGQAEEWSSCDTVEIKDLVSGDCRKRVPSIESGPVRKRPFMSMHWVGPLMVDHWVVVNHWVECRGTGREIGRGRDGSRGRARGRVRKEQTSRPRRLKLIGF